MRSPLVLCAAAALTSSALVLLPGAATATSLPDNCTPTAQTVTCTFGFTGGEQTFDVPGGVTRIGVTATGGSGGSGAVPSGSGPSAPGGHGAVVTADLPVNPGQPLFVEVGGAATTGCDFGNACNGGFNGGGSSIAGGGGGGGSDIRTRANALDSRVLVAAGGGGGGKTGRGEDPSGPSAGGAGGNAGAAGDNGGDCQIVEGGTGGEPATQTEGGSGGFPHGANGTIHNGGGFIVDSGGGGGGRYGGGSGGQSTVGQQFGISGSGGGGGGSNLVPSGGTAATAGNTGDGRIVITYAVPTVDTSTTVTVDPATSVHGQPVTYGATVAAVSGTATPGGTVAFTTGTTTLCTATLTNGQGSCTASNAPTGTDPITGAYSGTNGFNPSTGTATETVTAAMTTTTLTVTPATPSRAGNTETLTATLSPPAAAGTVQFLDDTSNVGTAVPVANGTASTTTKLPVGRHSLTAVFTPTDPGAFTGSTSTPVGYVVYATATTTKLITAAPLVRGVPVVLTALVSPFTAAGTVTFTDGTTPLGAPVRVLAGVAATTVPSLTAGPHSLTAVFTPTDPTAFGPSTSTPLTVNVR